MNRARTVSYNIYTVVVALSVPLLMTNPARAQESGTEAGAKSGAGSGTVNGAAPVSQSVEPAADASLVKPKKIIFKPGVPLTINTANETIKVTNDAKLAKSQVDNFPDSPEAHFVLAVALTRTSQVEEALKEIRTARKLSTARGGAVYFDEMINEYETMLKNYPEDNQVRYHLAWAYYMKAYVLARYSKQVKQAVDKNPDALPEVAARPAEPAAPIRGDVVNNDKKSRTFNKVEKTDEKTAAAVETPAPAAQQPRTWQDDFVGQSNILTAEELKEDAIVSTAAKSEPGKVADARTEKDYVNLGEEQDGEKPGFTPPAIPPANAPAHSGNNFWANPLGSLTNLGPITGMEYATKSASPEVIPQVKAYYRRALKKLDEVIEREPDDLWAKLYRAHLKAEYSGDIDSAMKVWESCREAHPNNPAPYFFLGEGYLKKGDLRQCLTNVSKAIALRTTGN